ncbi:MAG TPA: alpha/beta family hydrolase [Acetobacteraceae bacterium]|nr:alpha/beta family hydrolase [Acetobacteraceae bacterium]
MSGSNARKISIRIDDTHLVSGLLEVPPRARACYVLAHGAGAGMSHPFMAAVATELGERGVATLRYQFPYMEQGSKRPDGPALAHATVRAAVAEATRLVPDIPLVAGGKSFGGRMTSQAQAIAPLANVRGLAFLGFPLHPAKKPSDDRGQHLFDVRIPMLFLQGTRDALADLSLLAPLVQKLGARATLKLFAGADHSFHVAGRTGPSDVDVRGEILDAISAWCSGLGSQGLDRRAIPGRGGRGQ